MEREAPSGADNTASWIIRTGLVLLFWTLLLHAVVVARGFLYPLVLGLLFALMLFPLAVRFERWGLPRILANVLGLLLGVGAIYGVLLFVYRQLALLVGGLPDIKQRALERIMDLAGGMAGRVGMGFTAADEQALLQRVEEGLKVTGETIAGVANATGNTLLGIGLLPVYVFLFLYYRDKFKRFILMVWPDATRDTGRTVLTKVARVATRYMTGMALVVAILMVVNTAGLAIIGVEQAAFFGVLAALCNFIPYFGTIIGYAIPFVFTLLVGDAPDMALKVLLLFVVVQFMENNIITPNIVGGMLRINPFFIITGVLAGGMLWGLPGMFVVVPVLAMLKVLCGHLPGLSPWAFLLGDRGTGEHAITAGGIRRFFAFSKRARRNSIEDD